MLLPIAIACGSKKEAEEAFGEICWLKKPVEGFFDPDHDGRPNSTFQSLRKYGNREVEIIGFKPNGSPLSCELFIDLPGETPDEAKKIVLVRPSDFKGGKALLRQVGVPKA